MSHFAVAWAIQQRLDPYKFRVLVALADRQNSQTKRCDPSIETIASDTMLAPRTVQVAIKALAGAGLLEIRLRQRRSSQYDLLTHVTVEEVEKPARAFSRPKFPDLVDLMGAADAPLDAYPAADAPFPEDTFEGASDDNQGCTPRRGNLGKEPWNEDEYTRTRERNDTQAEDMGATDATKATVPTAKARSTRGCRIPEGWTPTEHGRQFAIDLGLDPQSTLDAFQDYWRGRAGKDGVKLDWEATWRNRCRFLSQNARKQAPRPTRFRGGQADLADEYEEAMRHLGRER